MSQKPIPVRERHLSEIPNSAVADRQMSLSDRCRPITILWEGQRHKWRISHELFHFLHRKSLIGRHLVLWDWNFVTEYEGHVFRVATYLAHYWTITWLSSRRQTVISTVLDSDCLWTALLSTAGCKSRDTNRAILLDFKLAYFKTIECYGVTILPIFSEKCPRKQVHYWLNYVSKAFQTYDLHICQRK